MQSGLVAALQFLNVATDMNLQDRCLTSVEATVEWASAVSYEVQIPTTRAEKIEIAVLTASDLTEPITQFIGHRAFDLDLRCDFLAL